MTGFIVNVFSFRNRVSSKEAFEGLELGEGKPSRPVLRGPGGRKAAWLLGSDAVNPEARPSAVFSDRGPLLSGSQLGLRLERLLEVFGVKHVFSTAFEFDSHTPPPVPAFVSVRCSNWNPFKNFEKRQKAANLCVFKAIKQASQASDVGSIPIARSKFTDDSIAFMPVTS
jgi:hypothetical protein